MAEITQRELNSAQVADGIAEEPNDHQNTDLYNTIEKTGLDATYWTKVLEDPKFDIKDLSQLKKISQNQFESLKLYSRMYLEFVTLKSLIKNSEPNERINKNESMLNLINRLGLVEYFPAKISLEKVLSITSHYIDNKSISDLKIVPWVILQRLITMDYKGRDEVLDDYISHKRESTKRNENGTSSTNNDDIDDDNPFDDSDTPTDSDTLSPLDVFLSIFCCCNPMLKQVLVAKLFMCKLAIPFVYPDPDPDSLTGSLLFSLWPLRSITLELKPSENIASEMSVVRSNIQKCAFIRVGRPRFSKSKIMNEILNQNSPHTFFNKDCPLGISDRKISHGYMEVAWYVPSKDPSDIFNDPFAFINLRGDVGLCNTHLNIIFECANIIVVAVDLNIVQNPDHLAVIEEILANDSPAIFILCFSPEDFQKSGEVWRSFTKNRTFDKKKNPYIVTVDKTKKEEKNSVTIRNEICKKILSVCTITSSTNLEKVAEKCIIKGHFTSDEQCWPCIEGWSHAEDILGKLNEIEIDRNIKEYTIPLQGETWCKWTELQKKKFKSGQQISMEERVELDCEMRNIRKRQNGPTIKMSEVMKSFIKTLVEKIDDNMIIQYFITWLKLGLDQRSRKVVPQLRQHHDQLWKKNAPKSEIDDAERDLTNASFGLEHLVRELGQLYEATAHGIEINKSVNDDLILKLPDSVAKLILLGYSFEVMDGDAVNIPLEWLKAVFKCLQSKLKDKKIFTLSVLGIQSSGKSTLLNTMFGLQFAVSVGRCTRGAFIRMVQVCRETTQLSYDYVMIIDTEGLRSSNRSKNTYYHDNELATLVIGMGDITVVNVKGENTSEVEDVLQIVVHAFLRMKLANQRLDVRRSCVFVHQNVAASDAESKMKHQIYELVGKLNVMTREAASQENIENIQSFDEVIKFDGKGGHVWYLSGLWHGDPPMSPANPGYSSKMKRLRSCLLNELALNRETFLSISETFQHIEDLWKGILTDDFVFSFRNSLEVKAFNALELTFKTLILEYEEEIHKWMNLNVDHQMKNCPTLTELDRVCNILETALDIHAGTVAEGLQQKLDFFFRDSDLKDILEQWHQNRKQNLRLEFSNILIRNKREIQEKIKQFSELLITKSEQTKLEKDINRLAKEIAEQYKGKDVSDYVSQRIFNDVWDEWLADLKLDKSDKRDSIDCQIKEALYRCIKESDKSSLNAELDQSSLLQFPNISRLKGSIKDTFFNKSLLQIKTVNVPRLKFWRKESLSSCAEKAVQRLNIFLAEIDNTLTDITSADKKFNQSFIRLILKKLFEEIKHHNEDEYVPFKYLSLFNVRIAAHVCRYSLKLFSEMDERYREKHSVFVKLQEYKAVAKKLFMDTLRDKTEEETAVHFLSERFKSLVAEEVTRIIPTKIEGNITSDFVTKFHLMANVLDDLVEQRDFYNFLEYLNKEATYTQSWIRDYTRKKVFSQATGEQIGSNQSKYEMWTHAHISELIGVIKSSIGSATTQATSCGIEKWIDILEKQLKDKIPISSGEFCHVLEFRKIKDFKNLEQRILMELSAVEKCLILEFSKHTDSNLYSRGDSLSKNIFQRLWGCTSSCPFCKEPCQRSVENHTEDHSCILHRPQGVTGWRYTDSKKLIVNSCSIELQNGARFKCGTVCKINNICDWKPSHGEDLYHPYREYRRFFSDWTIEPSVDIDSNKYWLWFIVTFLKELTDHYSVETPFIPPNWHKITPQDAKDSLRLMYKI